MPELDIEAIERVQLDSEGFDAACEAAVDAERAGMEPQEQMRRAIQAYIWVCDGKPKVCHFAGPCGWQNDEGARFAATDAARERKFRDTVDQGDRG